MHFEQENHVSIWKEKFLERNHLVFIIMILKINDFIQVAFFKPCLDLFFLEIDEDDKEGDNNEKRHQFSALLNLTVRIELELTQAVFILTVQYVNGPDSKVMRHYLFFRF